jgi:hypothetical protein
MNSACCAEAIACASDAACLPCLQGSATCAPDPAVEDLAACLQASCPSQCPVDLPPAASSSSSTGGGPGPCIPTTCKAAGASCGILGDGCGNILQCGLCWSTCVLVQCGASMPNACGAADCVPRTCADVGAECGPVSDGCCGTLQCGPCPEGQACGASQPNVCGPCP